MWRYWNIFAPINLNKVFRVFIENKYNHEIILRPRHVIIRMSWVVSWYAAELRLNSLIHSSSANKPCSIMINELNLFACWCLHLVPTFLVLLTWHLIRYAAYTNIDYTPLSGKQVNAYSYLNKNDFHFYSSNGAGTQWRGAQSFLYIKGTAWAINKAWQSPKAIDEQKVLTM